MSSQPSATLTWTREQAALTEWDLFVQGSSRGHYCQLSTWLESYVAYGFTYEVLIVRSTDSGAIVGGVACLIVGRWPVAVFTAPVAPLVEPEWDHLANQIVDASARRARDHGCVLMQFQPLASDTADDSCLLPRGRVQLHATRPGAPFGIGLAPSELNWIEFPAVPGESWRNAMLARFAGRAQRNIKAAEKHDIELVEAQSQNDLQQAFELIEANGREQGYATRTWSDFGPYLQTQVQRGHAYVLLAHYGGRACGAYYGVIAGRRMSYMMGGTLRMKPDLNLGYLLQWTAMKKAHSLGLRGYDLTSGGAASVLAFKQSFGPVHIQLVKPAHIVLAPMRFELLRRAYPQLRKNRARLARVLSAVRAIRG